MSISEEAIEKAQQAWDNACETGNAGPGYRSAWDAALSAAAPLTASRELFILADELEEHLGEFGPGNRNTGYGRAALDLLGRIRVRANELEAAK